MNRKEALKLISTGVLASAALPTLTFCTPSDSRKIWTGSYPFTLPSLGYNYDALSSVIDKETMMIHHTKHHQGYINKLNEALEGEPNVQKVSIKNLLMEIDSQPASLQSALKNHGGGYLNHALFWKTLTPGGVAPTKDFTQAIVSAFGSMEALQNKMTSVAGGVFGSGWAWLVTDNAATLSVMGTSNQDNPLSDGQWPILGIDVWEHAYYLKYQNKRTEYVSKIFSIVDWNQVQAFYSQRFSV